MSARTIITTLQQLATQIQGVDTADCPALLGLLELLKAQTWATMMNGRVAGQPDLMLSIQQVAARLGVPDSCAYELARQKKITSVRVGKYIRITEADLKAYEASLKKA